MGNSPSVNAGKSFITEALIISISNFIVKIFGVLFKIPMAHILGENMGIFNAAYSVYAMLFMVSNSGLPVAVSRMVAEAKGKNRPREIKRVYRLSVAMLGTVGFVCSLFLFFGAEAIGNFSQHANAALAMKVISPTLFLICITSAVRGYFQGLENMVPTAVSQLIETFFKIVLGLVAVIISKHAGASPAVQAAWAISGLTIGSAICTLYMLASKKRHDIKHKPDLSLVDSLSYNELSKKLMLIALPAALTSSALYLTHFLDTMVINKVLTAGGMSLQVAERYYSAYTTYAVPIADLLPSTLIYPIAISILPTVSSALAKKDRKKAKYCIFSSIRISGIIAFPCAFVLCALARPTIGFIFGTAGEPVDPASGLKPIDTASIALSILALGIIFMSMLSTTNALLQACKKSYLPMISVGCGVLLLTGFEIALVSVPQIGIYGAPLSTLICNSCALGLNMYFLKKTQRLKLNFFNLFAKPALSGLASGVGALGTYRLLYALIKSESRSACFLYLICAGIVAVALYVGIMLLINGIRENEVRLLPKGNKIADYLIKKGFLKTK